MYAPSASVRRVPLAVLLGSSSDAHDAAQRLRGYGWGVYVVRSPQGVLRVATALGPDAIVVDALFPDHVQRLLAAHPLTATVRVIRLGTPEAVEHVAGSAPRVATAA